MLSVFFRGMFCYIVVCHKVFTSRRGALSSCTLVRKSEVSVLSKNLSTYTECDSKF